MYLIEANILNEPKWVMEYSTEKDYGMKNLSPAEMQKLMQR